LSPSQPAGAKQPNLRSAYLWTITGNLTKHFVGLGISVLLARFLQPEDYGLLGMVWVYITILSAIQDLGLGQAIVHFRDSQETLPTYFSTTVIFGILLTALSFASAGGIASFYHEPRLVPLVRALSPILLISSFQSVATGLLSKEFRFRELTMAEMVSTIVAGIVGVVMAFMGFGVWSLVTNLILSNLLQTLLLCIAVPPRLTLKIDRPTLGRIIGYGLPLTASGLLHQIYDNADYLVVGKMVGSIPLGHYTLAFRLSTIANDKISAVINKVAFPSFAWMQDDKGKVIRHWFLVSRTVSLVVFPLIAVLFVNAPDLMVVVFGAKWLPAASPLRFLCIVGAIRTNVHLMLHIFNALGHPKLRLQFGVLNALLLPISFVIGCRVAGLNGVGAAWCITYPFIFLFTLVKLHGILPFRYRDYFFNLRNPVLVTAGCALVMYVVGGFESMPLVRLILRCMAGGLIAGAFLLSRQRVRTELRALLKSKRMETIA
jgi:teichuronic acid exporter